MALVQYGGGVLDMRGSIGGQVHSRNRSGNYIRARTTPVNPKSDRQNKIRAAIQLLAQQWSNVLTAAQRAAWEVYSAAVVRTNKLGAQIKLMGFNDFVRSNSIRLQSDLSIILDAPTTLTLPPGDPIMIGTVDEAGQQISVAFDDSLDWVDQSGAAMFVYMSIPKSAGTTFVGGPFRLAGLIAGDDTTAPTSPEVLSVPFPVAENQTIVVRARIGEVDGRLSELFRSQSAVVAGS